MTGFEYTAAAGMLYAGLTEEGLRAVRDVRARYDGRRRNPFDEAECGHHYARALVSWALVLACTGFHWDAPTATMTFSRAEGARNDFWAAGGAWGTFTQRPGSRGVHGELTLLRGPLDVRRLRLLGSEGVRVFDLPRGLALGEPFIMLAD